MSSKIWKVFNIIMICNELSRNLLKGTSWLLRSMSHLTTSQGCKVIEWKNNMSIVYCGRQLEYVIKQILLMNMQKSPHSVNCMLRLCVCNNIMLLVSLYYESWWKKHLIDYINDFGELSHNKITNSLIITIAII